MKLLLLLKNNQIYLKCITLHRILLIAQIVVDNLILSLYKSIKKSVKKSSWKKESNLIHKIID